MRGGAVLLSHANKSSSNRGGTSVCERNGARNKKGVHVTFTVFVDDNYHYMDKDERYRCLCAKYPSNCWHCFLEAQSNIAGLPVLHSATDDQYAM